MVDKSSCHKVPEEVSRPGQISEHCTAVSSAEDGGGGITSHPSHPYTSNFRSHAKANY